MKINLLHYSVPPIVGGVESVIEHHASLMANDGHQVQVIAGRGEQADPRVRFITMPRVDSRNPQVLSVKQELDKGVISSRFTSLTADIEADLTPLMAGTDLVIAHNVCSLSKNLALTAALFNLSQKNKTPRMILWHHDLAWTTPRYQDELHPGFPWDLLKTAWPGVKQVVISALRQEELAGLMKLEKSQITVVPNGVDVEKFFKLEQQTRSHVQQLDLMQASPLLLLPVRITPRKNIEFAMRVLGVLRKDFPSAQIVVTGPLGPHNPANVEKDLASPFWRQVSHVCRSSAPISPHLEVWAQSSRPILRLMPTRRRWHIALWIIFQRAAYLVCEIAYVPSTPGSRYIEPGSCHY
jgi:glycosyltransferase involved in cell wall biosynthesis